MPVVRCKLCNRRFYAKPSWIKSGGGKYCSRKCQYASYRKGRVVSCFICGKRVYKSPRYLKRATKHFCSKSCQTKWRNTIFIGSKHANWKEGRYAYRSVLSRHKIPRLCKLCKTKDSRILAVHHIDMDHSNNRLSNLVWLCHNCHFLVHHYDIERKKIMVPVA